jgi:hypothetical protein
MIVWPHFNYEKINFGVNKFLFSMVFISSEKVDRSYENFSFLSFFLFFLNLFRGVLRLAIGLLRFLSCF